MYQLKEKEMIFVFTGPDGAGRKTVADMVGNTLGLSKVLSYTTRQPRATEVDGQDYHFISREQFLKARENGDFIESIEIDDNLYGIGSRDIEDLFKTNGFIYLILNSYGAKVLKELYGDKVTRIFIYVDKNIVAERQKLQGASDELIQAHLKHYEEDMAYKSECKYAVENSDLAHSVFSVSNILDQYMNRNLVDKD